MGCVLCKKSCGFGQADFALCETVPISLGMKRMTHWALAACMMILPAALPAADTGVDAAEEQLIFVASDVTLEELLWLKRPVVVFADSAADPRYVQQIQLITERLEDLRARDVIVLTDTDPSDPSDIRLKLRPRGFMLALIGKDGQVKLRKPAPWDMRELTRVIDKMPLRQQEIRDRRDANILN